MSGETKERLGEGFVPQKRPKKPEEIKGFAPPPPPVPPPQPKKPPKKPSDGEK